MTTYHGTFTAYTPSKLPEGMPPEFAARVLWVRNEFGEDLYELRKRLPKGARFVTVNPDDSIRVVHTDPDHVWPAEGGRLYSTTEEVPTDPSVLLSKRFNPTSLKIEDKPVEVPVKVSKAQAQLALFNAGLLDDLEVIILNHPYRPIRIWYESANEWRRDNPYVAALGPELGLTEEQIDALFIAASKFK